MILGLAVVVVEEDFFTIELGEEQRGQSPQRVGIVSGRKHVQHVVAGSAQHTRALEQKVENVRMNLILCSRLKGAGSCGLIGWNPIFTAGTSGDKFHQPLGLNRLAAQNAWKAR